MAYVPAQNVTNNIAFLMEEMNMPYEFAVGYTANKMAESGNLLDPFARNPNGPLSTCPQILVVFQSTHVHQT